MNTRSDFRDIDDWDIDAERPMQNDNSQSDSKLALLKNEQEWLDAYRARLDEKFPGLVQEIAVYGPRARGNDHPASEFCTLIIINEGDWFQKDAVGSLGHMVDMEDFFAAPVIMVYTREEWQERERTGSDFFQSVMRSTARIV